MRFIRPLGALALLGALVLTGCSSDTSPEASGSPEASNSPSSDAAADRTVTTDYGDVVVPGDAERIVVLNYALAGYLYTLDVPVFATIPEDADATEGEFSPAWAADAEADGTVFLPWSVDGFDLEAILESDPDLIIGGGIGFPLFQAEQVYDELSAIAPTVLVGKALGSWQQQFDFLANDVFDRGEEYDAAIAAYDTRVEEVAATITPPPSPVSFLTFTADGTAYALVETVGLPTEFAAVGIEPAPIFAEGDFEVYGGGGDMFELSTEQAGQVITQPTVFVMGFNGDTIDVATLMENPVYAALPAFQSSNAYDLPYNVLRGDYDDAMELLDIIESLFATTP
ncbi:ABC transporter substrate-binding protein [Humidisolicoccus flavus]|uniref:ABC transporter substrate-binding protein n=1 Tax=Humidisolicoccus flavus TaxID=3111414 RepID=UPI003255C02A